MFRNFTKHVNFWIMLKTRESILEKHVNSENWVFYKLNLWTCWFFKLTIMLLSNHLSLEQLFWTFMSFWTRMAIYPYLSGQIWFSRLSIHVCPAKAIIVRLLSLAFSVKRIYLKRGLIITSQYSTKLLSQCGALFLLILHAGEIPHNTKCVILRT